MVLQSSKETIKVHKNVMHHLVKCDTKSNDNKKRTTNIKRRIWRINKSLISNQNVVIAFY